MLSERHSRVNTNVEEDYRFVELGDEGVVVPSVFPASCRKDTTAAATDTLGRDGDAARLYGRAVNSVQKVPSSRHGEDAVKLISSRSSSFELGQISRCRLESRSRFCCSRDGPAWDGT